MNKLITILFLGDTVCYKDLEHEEISFKITEGYDSIFHKISKILKSNFFIPLGNSAPLAA